MMTYQEAVDYIEETPKFTKKNSLDHTRAFLKRLGSPESRMKILHVAGTNGKGSVCAFLTSMIREAHATVVAPVVNTSSTINTCFPIKDSA
mgnify:CR=1 FL=1